MFMDNSKKKYKTNLEPHDTKIKELTELVMTFEHQDHIREIATTVVKLGSKTDIDLKLINTVLKELRYV